MNFIKKIISQVWEKVFVFFGVLSVLLPTSPLNMPLVFRDSGVFLYIGWRILNGELPYHDIWDHKPPVIFYLNALGLAIAGNSRWGVWLIEFIALFVAAYIGYQLVKKFFGLIPAVISLFIWLLALVLVLQGGNFTTEYTLSLQFIALWITSKFNTPAIKKHHYLFLGITSAVAFFTKQTTIGIWIAIFVYLFFNRLAVKKTKELIQEFTWIVAGGFLVTLITIGFFWIQSAFSEFWGAAFEYNFAYSLRSDGDFVTRSEALIRGLRPLTRTGLLQIAIVGYGIALVNFFWNKKTESSSSVLISISLLALPIELFLIAIPQKTFPHYYITLLPVLCILAGWCVYNITWVASKLNIRQVWQYVIAIFAMGLITLNYYYLYLDQAYIYRKLRDDTGIQYIISNTKEDETVLLLGAETSVNFFAKRKSPTKFIYQYPLQEENYVTEEMIIEFLDDILENQPQLIINTDTAKAIYEFPIQSEAIREKVEKIQEQYCSAGEIDQWEVYKLCTP